MIILDGEIVVIDGECLMEDSVDGDCDLLSPIDGEGIQVIEISRQNYYEGDYTIIPDIVAQTMATKDKLMADDVTVTEIKTYEVSNAYGTTFYIARMEE